MNIFGSVQLQILGKKLESTNNIKQLQSKFLLDENETTQPMRTRVTKVRQAKPSVQNYPKCKPCRAQKRKKNLKNQHCRLSILPPPDRVSALSTKCGRCHPKGLIVAS